MIRTLQCFSKFNQKLLFEFDHPCAQMLRTYHDISSYVVFDHYQEEDIV